MQNIRLRVWEDDLPEEIMERLAGVLCELGIVVTQVANGMDGDFVVWDYQFDLDDLLPEHAILEV